MLAVMLFMTSSQFTSKYYQEEPVHFSSCGHQVAYSGCPRMSNKWPLTIYGQRHILVPLRRCCGTKNVQKMETMIPGSHFVMTSVPVVLQLLKCTSQCKDMEKLFCKMQQGLLFYYNECNCHNSEENIIYLPSDINCLNKVCDLFFLRIQTGSEPETKPEEKG